MEAAQLDNEEGWSGAKPACTFAPSWVMKGLLGFQVSSLSLVDVVPEHWIGQSTDHGRAYAKSPMLRISTIFTRRTTDQPLRHIIRGDMTILLLHRPLRYRGKHVLLKTISFVPTLEVKALDSSYNPFSNRVATLNWPPSWQPAT